MTQTCFQLWEYFTQCYDSPGRGGGNLDLVWTGVSLTDTANTKFSGKICQKQLKEGNHARLD